MAAGHPSQVELTGSDLSIEALAAVARDPAVRVTCCAKAMKRVERCHQEIETIVGRYREAYAAGKRGDELPHVYGITTGFGEFKTIPVDPDHLGELQANILRSHATGVGDTTDVDDFGNYFPAEVVRAALVIRLNTFLKGHSGVRPEMAFFVRDMINAGVIPLVPTRGSVGSSGDLCPLAHLFVVMLEEETAGRFYVAASREDVRRSRGEAISATRLRETMAGRLKYGGDWQIPKPSYKDGLSLTNGAAFSAAGLALAVHDATELANTADVAAAMTLESICGRTRALDEKVHRVRNMRGQADSAANILKVLSGGKLVDLSEEVQDVYSVRCAPQVHGASRDAIAYAKMAALAEINAATDNPLFFPDETGPCDMTRGNSGAAYPNVDGRAYSAGNFHGQPVGLAADFLAIAVAELANVSERRTQMLLDKHHNRGLPASLTANPGVHSGFMIAQYCAAGLVSENKVLAHPASVDSIPTSANYEDHVAMASIAARKVRTVLANTQSTLAIELMAAAQALDWRIRLRTTPSDGGKVTAEAFASARAAFGKGLSTGSAAALACIRGVVGPLCEDRVLAEDIRAIRRLIEDGAVRSAVESAVGELRAIEALR